MSKEVPEKGLNLRTYNFFVNDEHFPYYRFRFKQWSANLPIVSRATFQNIWQPDLEEGTAIKNCRSFERKPFRGIKAFCQRGLTNS